MLHCMALECLLLSVTEAFADADYGENVGVASRSRVPALGFAGKKGESIMGEKGV